MLVMQLIGGLALLYVGGEALVAGAARLALRARVTPLAIGLTVVAFGTSSPELVVSVGATLGGTTDIALGNVVGSNIANVLLILGVASLIRPVRARLGILRRDLPVMILCSAALVWIMASGGRISRVEGAVMVACLVAYVVWQLVTARRESALGEDSVPVPRFPRVPEVVLVVVGLVTLTVGAKMFVTGAVGLARLLHWSEAFIGLTVVAVGTSLPELAASTVAAYRGEGDIAIGNVIGSNVFNVLGILGACAVVAPLPRGGILPGDFVVMIGAAVILLPFVWTGLRLERWEGGVLVAGYAGYVAWRLLAA